MFKRIFYPAVAHMAQRCLVARRVAGMKRAYLRRLLPEPPECGLVLLWRARPLHAPLRRCLQLIEGVVFIPISSKFL